MNHWEVGILILFALLAAGIPISFALAAVGTAGTVAIIGLNPALSCWARPSLTTAAATPRRSFPSS
ncbi:hypothetical protein V6L77_25100 [Pannonibacter sp. Pt2-lr]